MRPRNSGPAFLAVAHLKGGSGGTTLAVNLAAGLALSRPRRTVLLLDLDPVAAATFSLLEETPEQTLADVLDNRAELPRVIRETALQGLSIAPGSPRLAAWDRKPERFPVELSRALAAVDADVAVIDLPPSSGAIVRGALAVLPGGRVLAPVQARALDLVGFRELLLLIESLQEQNEALHVLGIVPMRTNRTRLALDVIEALESSHPGKVFPGIRDSVGVARAPLSHKPLQLAVPQSPAREDFDRLTHKVAKALQ